MDKFFCLSSAKNRKTNGQKYLKFFQMYFRLFEVMVRKRWRNGSRSCLSSEWSWVPSQLPYLLFFHKYVLAKFVSRQCTQRLSRS